MRCGYLLFVVLLSFYVRSHEVNTQRISNSVNYKESAHRENRNVVDIFPSQNWDSLFLGAANVEPMQTESAIMEQEPEPVLPSALPLPFYIIGEWVEGGERIIFLGDDNGDSYLVCNGCNLPTAIKTGEKITKSYRLKQLDLTKLTVVSESGEELDLFHQ